MRVESDTLYRRDEFAFSCQCFVFPNYDFTWSGGAHSRMRWSSRCHNLSQYLRQMPTLKFNVRQLSIGTGTSIDSPFCEADLTASSNRDRFTPRIRRFDGYFSMRTRCFSNKCSTRSRSKSQKHPSTLTLIRPLTEAGKSLLLGLQTIAQRRNTRWPGKGECERLRKVWAVKWVAPELFAPPFLHVSSFT